MAEAVAVAVAISLLKSSVVSLLSYAANERVSSVWAGNKDYERLRGMLSRLEPVVSSISPTGGGSDASTQAWLEALRERLEAIKKVLQESSGLKLIFQSSRLVKETVKIGNLFDEASIVSLQASLTTKEEVSGMRETLTEISEQLREVRQDMQRREMAEITKMAMKTPTSYYGSDVGVITTTEAYGRIKDQADSMVWTSSSSTRSPPSALPINIQQAASTGGPVLRRQDSYTIFGGDEVVEKAKILLQSSEAPRWVGLWASGGAGKTLAAQRIFNDSSLLSHFEGNCSWVTVAKDIRPANLLAKVRWEITGRSDKPNLSSDTTDFKNQLSWELRDREKLLLVLDDVWDGQLLDRVDVLPNRAACKVLVTTRNEEVLNHKHAAKLQVIGRAFAGKTDVSYWHLSLLKLQNADILSDDHEVQLYLRLKLSVDDLPRIHLKDCFLYFAAFPEDKEVKVEEDVLPFWLGERIVGKNSDYNPVDEAYELLGWLISSSLIELHSKPSKSAMIPEFMSCKVHDVLRDLARYILQHNTATSERVCLYEAGRNLKCVPVEWAPPKGSKPSGTVTLSACRMSVMQSNLKDLPPKLFYAPKLQVLLLRDNPLTVIPDGFFCNLRNLRVLDLRHTFITTLPSSFGDLKLLVVLNLSQTELAKLPPSLGNLSNLEQLNLDVCKKLDYLPSKLSSLTRLRILSVMASRDVWMDKGVFSNWAGKGGLKDLTHLVALEQLCITSQSQKKIPTGLTKALKELRILELLFPELMSFPEPGPDDLQQLEVLRLNRCQSLTSLPASFGSLQCLATLVLTSCSGLLSLPDLDHLPQLLTLQLDGCCELRSLPVSFGRPGAFPVLKHLSMFNCCKVASFPEIMPGAMLQLVSLNLSGWVQLDTVPKSLVNLTTLRSLSLGLCIHLQSLEHDSFCFQKLPNLEELNLETAKQLSELPASIGSLYNLRKLNIRACPAFIPDELEFMILHRRIQVVK
ncbi:unnamed protein product [Sphagnum jensenii]|uniref:Uncharacterized protein n=1 Tax=Sphagnum jensenii TaxID=128206 RepID=A0ABP1ACH3_9BRYO